MVVITGNEKYARKAERGIYVVPLRALGEQCLRKMSRAPEAA